MSYDLTLLAEQAVARLADDPHVTLERIAQDLGVDRKTINRALLKTRGASFSALRQRLQQARISAALGANRLLSVKQAAEDSGFHSANALARRVKRLFGATPSQLRRRRA